MRMKTIYCSGERPVPERHNTGFLESVKRYEFVKECARDKVVLDLGCGLGDGACILAQTARQVTGVDYSSEVIQEAQKRTVAKNVTFMVSDVRALRLPDAHFDLVSAFEIIEHLAEPKEFLEEIVRVLKPGGTLAISTPNNTTGRAPTAFHLKEYHAQELVSVLKNYFGTVTLYGLHRPKEVYRLEDELRKVRQKDILGVRKIIPRFLIYLIVHAVARAKKITPPEAMQFAILKDAIEGAEVLLALCQK